MTEPLKFAMVFTADKSQLEAASKDVRADVEAVGSEATDTAAALDKNTASLEKNAAAAKKAADAARDQAKAEADARAAVNRSTGTATTKTPASVAVPSASPSGATPSGAGAGGPTAKQLDDLRAKYVPLYAAQREYQEELAKIQEAEKAGALTADQSALALARLKLGYDNQVISITRSNEALGGSKEAIALTSNEYKLLAHNISDTFQGFALGIPIEQVLMQQGPALAENVGGIGNAYKLLTGALTVGNIALAATAAAVVVGAVAWSSYLSSIKQVETAATGIGRSVAGTASDMETAAQGGAAAAGITVKAARSMEAEFLNTGKIGSDNFQKLISVSKDFATTIGVSSDDAGKALADLFADPAKAAGTLYHQFGLIDGATAEYATRLAAQNRISEAQNVLLDGLPGRLSKATDATTLLGRAWKDAANFAENAFDAFGKAIDRTVNAPSLSEQVADAKKKLDDAASAKTATEGSVMSRIFGNLGDADYQKALAEYNKLKAQLDKQEADDAKKRADDQARAAGAAAVTIAGQSPANATQTQIEKYQDDIAALQKGANAPGTSAEQQQQNAAAIAAKSAALATLINKQAALSELDRLDIQIQNERNPIVQADLVARREKIQQTMQEANVVEAEAAAERARQQVIESTIASAAAQASDMRAELEIRKRLDAQVAAGVMTSAEAQQQIQEEIQLRPLVIAAAAAEGDEKIRLTKVLSDLRAGYAGLAEEQKKASAQDFIKGQNDNLDTLKAQQSVLGENEAAQARVTAQLAAEQKIRDLGISTSSAEATQIRSNATAISDMTSSLDKAKDAWSTYQQAGTNAIDTIFDGIAAGDKFSDIGKSLITSIGKAALQLAVENPIKNALFGTNLGTIDDLFKGKSGGILSSLGGQTTGTMNVTAATVMVNGGVTGGLGGIQNLLGGNSSAANSNLTGNISSYASAIKSVESGGNYSALGPVTSSGDRAYGAYQVMGANIPSWTKSALGQSMTPSQFVANPSAQDAVFGNKFGGYLSKDGNGNDAISRWFSGRPMSTAGNASDGFNTVPQYVTKVNDQLEKLGGTAQTTTSNVGGLGSATGTAASGLNTLGGGLSKFGQALSSAQSSGNGGLASLLGSLTSYGQSVFNSSGQFAGAITSGQIGLFDEGGYTGPGGKLVAAGVVHKGEVVFSQADVARFGGPQAVESIRLGKRGYADGGVVESHPLSRIGAANSNSAGAAAASSRPSANFTFKLEGARGDKDIQNAAYVGMQQALDEYDRLQFPESWHRVSNNPRARG